MILLIHAQGRAEGVARLEAKFRVLEIQLKITGFQTIAELMLPTSTVWLKSKKRTASVARPVRPAQSESLAPPVQWDVERGFLFEIKARTL